MKTFEKAVLEPGFDLEEFLKKRTMYNLKKYPIEFYQKAWQIVTDPNEKNITEKIMQLVKMYNYQPF